MVRFSMLKEIFLKYFCVWLWRCWCEPGVGGDLTQTNMSRAEVIRRGSGCGTENVESTGLGED